MQGTTQIFSEKLFETLKANGKMNTYKKGAYIFKDKYPHSAVHILVQGKASICKMNYSNGQRTIFILGAVTLLNEPVSEETEAVDCIAFASCAVLSIEKEVFLKLMEADFQLTKIVIEQVSRKARRMYRQLKNADHTTTAAKRLAAKLWKLGRDHGVETEQGIKISLAISSIELAGMMGIRRETVSRAFRTLQDEDLALYEKRKVLIRDMDALSEYFKVF